MLKSREDKLNYDGVEKQDMIPIAHRLLFESEDDTRITEIPSNMIMPLVRLEIYKAASNPSRTTPLAQIFGDAYKALMISRDRKGRIEAVEVLSRVLSKEDDLDSGLQM